MIAPLIFVSGKLEDETPEQQQANIDLACSYAKMLRDIGFTTFIPHRAFGIETAEQLEQSVISREDIMSACFRHLATCDAIYMVPNYRRSSGALRELRKAEAFGMPVARTKQEAKRLYQAYLSAYTRTKHVKGHDAV